MEYVAEMEPGVDDIRVLERANQRQALLITADKDFGELVFRQNRLHAGVILLRLAGAAPARKADVVCDAVSAHGKEMESAFGVITRKSLRIRPRR